MILQPSVAGSPESNDNDISQSMDVCEKNVSSLFLFQFFVKGL